MSIQRRLSRVGRLHVDTVAFASTAQFGDNETTVLKSRTFAVQRAITDYIGDEIRFASYPIFFLPLLELRGGPYGRLNSVSPCGEISVGTVSVSSIVSASLLRFGGEEAHLAESRIKHIRQFNDYEPYPGQ